MKLNVDLIYTLIEKEGMSLTGFAKKVGMSHVGMKNALDNGTMNLRNLIKICEYFEKPIEYFFTENSMNHIDKITEESIKDIPIDSMKYRFELLTLIKDLVGENRKMFEHIRELERDKRYLFEQLQKFWESEKK